MCIRDRGATQISHLFNGFPKMNHRVDGAVVGCLLEDRLYAQLTVDGVHVLPPFIRLAIKNKGIDHVLGITDGSEYMGKPEGRYIGKTGEEYEIKDGMARDLTGMLLAGTHTFDSVMRTALSMGLTLEEVGRMYAELSLIHILSAVTTVKSPVRPDRMEKAAPRFST